MTRTWLCISRDIARNHSDTNHVGKYLSGSETAREKYRTVDKASVSKSHKILGRLQSLSL